MGRTRLPRPPAGRCARGLFCSDRSVLAGDLDRLCLSSADGEGALVGFEVDEDGGAAAIDHVVVVEVELVEDGGDVLLNGLVRDGQVVADGLVGAGFRDEGEHVELAEGEVVDDDGVAVGEQLFRELGVEHGLTGTDLADGVEDRVEAGEVGVEQERDGAGVVAEQFGSQASTVVGDDDHPDVGMIAAQPSGGFDLAERGDDR